MNETEMAGKKKDTVRIPQRAGGQEDDGFRLALRIQHGMSAPPRYLGNFVIGREPEGDDVWRIDDETMSRSHARVEHKRIVDLDSTNGLFVNGVRLHEAELRAGDVVRLGDTVFLFDEHADKSATGIIAEAAASLRAVRKADRAARFDVAVMLLGESGTGKEVFARYIHDASGRNGSFVAVNCAALPSELVESTLFGHLKGAFTGADRDTVGLFGEADGGTLFLDEIGEMPLTLQPKLLRVLETGEHIPVGGRKPVQTNVRILSATHVSLAKAAEEGRFRPDLYARLFGYAIELRPLRERRADILPLFRRFLGPAPDFSADFVETLLTYDFPLNVRELKAVAARVRLAIDNGEVTARLERRHLEDALPQATEEPKSSSDAPTREALVALLVSTRGNVEAVAQQLKRHRPQVYRWLKKYDLDPEGFR